MSVYRYRLVNDRYLINSSADSELADAIVSLALRDRITKTRADYHVGKDMCIRVDGQMNADVYKTNENKEMPTCLLTRTHCGCL
ncbi:unnamed protein product [Ceratitis capitata]|uniref:(Mediterranean fruit fly) hypothetical protein n=1 Tax=Ceratitis capitata TaxID=7213 RepID=A0A811UJY7_CERCA|nr:unnamed protein product [Ceratitis capitata]